MAQSSTSILLGNTSIELVQYKGSILNNVLFLNVHEDEQTSIEAIYKVRENHNVHFAYLAHEQTRNISFGLKKFTAEFDPNRIYTFKGRRATLKEFSKFSFKGNKEVKKLDLAIKNLIQKFNIVVTLHNNTDVNYTIKSYDVGGDESKNTADLNISENWDADDFIYTTDKKFFKAFKDLGLNAILQDNEACVNDGSLSVYCGKNEIPYINIEAQSGHLYEQIELIQTTLKVLENF